MHSSILSSAILPIFIAKHIYYYISVASKVPNIYWMLNEYLSNHYARFVTVSLIIFPMLII